MTLTRHDLLSLPLDESQRADVMRQLGGRPPTTEKTQRRGRMNKLESSYAAHLETLKRSGDIFDYRFEAMAFRLAPGVLWTPDFMVIRMEQGEGMFVEFHETKGSWKARNQRDARTRIKVAAGMFPFFDFYGARLVEGRWELEKFSAGRTIGIRIQEV